LAFFKLAAQSRPFVSIGLKFRKKTVCRLPLSRAPSGIRTNWLSVPLAAGMVSGCAVISPPRSALLIRFAVMPHTKSENRVRKEAVFL
jgi:hypothetical protein